MEPDKTIEKALLENNFESSNKQIRASVKKNKQSSVVEKSKETTPRTKYDSAENSHEKQVSTRGRASSLFNGSTMTKDFCLIADANKIKLRAERNLDYDKDNDEVLNYFSKHKASVKKYKQSSCLDDDLEQIPRFEQLKQEIRLQDKDLISKQSKFINDHSNPMRSIILQLENRHIEPTDSKSSIQPHSEVCKSIEMEENSKKQLLLKLREQNNKLKIKTHKYSITFRKRKLTDKFCKKINKKIETNEHSTMTEQMVDQTQEKDKNEVENTKREREAENDAIVEELLSSHCENNDTENQLKMSSNLSIVINMDKDRLKFDTFNPNEDRIDEIDEKEFNIDTFSLQDIQNEEIEIDADKQTENLIVEKQTEKEETENKTVKIVIEHQQSSRMTKFLTALEQSTCELTRSANYSGQALMEHNNLLQFAFGMLNFSVCTKLFEVGDTLQVRNIQFNSHDKDKFNQMQSMGYCSIKNILYMHGGFNHSGTLSDFQQLNFENGQFNLHQLKLNAAPVQRRNHRLFCADSKQIFIVGGNSDHQESEQKLQKINVMENSIVDCNTEQEVRLEPMVVKSTPLLMIFGFGQSLEFNKRKYQNDLYCQNMLKDIKTKIDIEFCTDNVMACVDRDPKNLMVFGGTAGNCQVFNKRRMELESSETHAKQRMHTGDSVLLFNNDIQVWGNNRATVIDFD